MSKRVVLVCGLCAVLSIDCSSTTSSPGSPDGSAPGLAAASLVGTWNLTTTEPGGAGIHTTVAIGQDSLAITSPEFSFTATRSGSTLTFTDNESPGSGPVGVLTATQTAAPFDTGILPFNLGGTWTMQAGSKGGSPSLSCTLSVTAGEIDGACQWLSPAKPWFSFTTTRTTAEASSLGDFGGTWTNSWTWYGTGGGTFPCTLDFKGNGITTCAGGGPQSGSPLAGITFTYDGANTASGAAQGWAEFSATR